MFVYCFDEDLKNKLLKQNYKMINKPNNLDYWVFINNNGKFDFSGIDPSKFKMSNKLDF